MQAEDLSRRVHQKPFLPFRMYLTDGSIYDVRHPELIMVGKCAAALGLTANPHQKAFDYRIDVDLNHVVRVEPIEALNSSNGQ